jgi:WD40 repeat protein
MRRAPSWPAMLFLLVGCGPSTATSPTAIQTETATPLPAATSAPSPPRNLSDLPAISLDNTTQLKEIDLFTAHDDAAAVVFSPLSDLLASYSADGTFRLWDLTIENGILGLRHGPQVMALAFSPDGSQIATGGSDKTVRVWDIHTATEVARYEGHSTGIGMQSLAWSPDGTLIAAGSCDGFVRIWDVDTGAERNSIYLHTDDVNGMTFSPDGSLLVSGGLDNAIRVWDVATESILATLTDHAVDVGDVSFSPDGSLLAFISGDYTGKGNAIFIWDTGSWQTIHRMEGDSLSWLGDVSFSPDGSIPAVSRGFAMNDGRIHLYDVATAELATILEGAGEGVIAVSFTLDGWLIASSSYDGIIQIWGID